MILEVADRVTSGPGNYLVKQCLNPCVKRQNLFLCLPNEQTPCGAEAHAFLFNCNSKLMVIKDFFEQIFWNELCLKLWDTSR